MAVNIHPVIINRSMRRTRDAFNHRSAVPSPPRGPKIDSLLYACKIAPRLQRGRSARDCEATCAKKWHTPNCHFIYTLLLKFIFFGLTLYRFTIVLLFFFLCIKYHKIHSFFCSLFANSPFRLDDRTYSNAVANIKLTSRIALEKFTSRLNVNKLIQIIKLSLFN